MTAERNSEASVIFGAPKVIYMISPQPWDGIKVSKHHYAAELAGLGHQVFFIEPPRISGAFGSVEIAPSDVEGVQRVSYRPWFPYWIKFRSRGLFDLGMRLEARLIAVAIGEPPDIVWDFDNCYQFADLRAFSSALKIFHPVDDLVAGQHGDKHADLLLAVLQQFLDDIEIDNRPVLLLPHGLNRSYAAYAQAILKSKCAPRKSGRPMVGYAGNLDHADIDWETTFEIIEANPGVDFVFIGPFTLERDGVPTALARINTYQNCQLTGLLSPAQMLEWAPRVDVWIMIFRCTAEVGGITGAHKVLEYLATGKSIVTTKVLPYVGSDLLYMASDHTNRDVPAILNRILSNLDVANSWANQNKRCAYALEHSYLANLRKVDAFIAACFCPHAALEAQALEVVG